MKTNFKTVVAPKTVSADNNKNASRSHSFSEKAQNHHAMIEDQESTPILGTVDNSSSTPVLDELENMLPFDPKENPSITFCTLFFDKNYFEKSDIMEATGLSEGQYSKLINERFSPEKRFPFTTPFAEQILEKHLNNEKLLLRQRLMSQLLWKTLKTIITAKRIREGQEADVNLISLLISADELEIALSSFLAHLRRTKKYA